LIFLGHHFVRLGLTRANALQTVSRFPRETHRRYAGQKSNTVAPGLAKTDLVSTIYMHYNKFSGFAPVGIVE